MDICPCMRGHEEYKFFNGSSPENICKRCEYKENLYDFIKKEFQDYSLYECCELKPENKKHPEAIFVNRKNPCEKIAIEVKSINKLFSTNKKQNNKLTAKDKKFHMKYINDISDTLLEALEISLINAKLNLRESIILMQFLCQNTSLCFDMHNSKGCTFKEFMLLLSQNELQDIYNNVKKKFCEYFNNIIEILNTKKGTTMSKSTIEYSKNSINYQINLTVAFTINKSEIRWFGNFGLNEFCPNNEMVNTKIYEYYEACLEKFQDYSRMKCILLIKNESDYFNNDLERIIRSIDSPEYINEIYLSKYEYEEEYSDDGDLEGEHIIDIHYIKIK